MTVYLSSFGGSGAQFFDNNGVPLSGGLIYSYQAGTTTPQPTYTSSAGNVAHTNPIVLDSAGRVPSGGEIWLTGGVTYKFLLKTSTGIQLASYDNVGAVSDLYQLGNTSSYPPGAALIGFKQGTSSGYYASAVARTVNSKLQESVSILDFGADPTGLTDSTVAVQAAFNSGASSVYAPSGTYLISSVQPASNQYIHGDGAATIFKQKAGANFVRPFLIASKSYITLDNFTIDGNGNNQAAGEQNHGVFIADSQDINVRNLIVHDCQGDGIGIYSSNDSILARRIRVESNTCYNFGRCGIVISGTGAFHVVIANNITRVGTRVTTSTSNGNGIHLELDSLPAVAPGWITISDNSVDDSITSSGIFSNLVIDSNVIRNTFNGTGFGLITSIVGTGLVISNNSISNLIGATGNAGIWIQDSVGAAMQNVVISGNSISGTTAEAIQCFSSAAGLSSPLVIDGNAIVSCAAGINVAYDMHTVVVTNNSFRAITTYCIRVGGTNGVLVANNAGLNFGGSGIIIENQGAAQSNGSYVIGNVFGNAVIGSTIGIELANTSAVSNIRVIANDFSGTFTPMSLGTSTVNISHALNTVGNSPLTGSFTLSAAATTTVLNDNVYSDCRITLTPTNAAAAALMGSAKCLYISAKTSKTSFAVTTGDGVAAAGTETFDYQINN